MNKKGAETMNLYHRGSSAVYFGPFTSERSARRTGSSPFPPAIIELARTEILRLDETSVTKCLKMVAGSIWLTKTPVDGDHILSVHDSIALTGGYPIIIQAIRDSRILLA
jgi:hypothetical protein